MYNRSRAVKDGSLVAPVEKQKNVFALECPTGKAEILLPLIEDYVEPLSIIHSDCWKAYNKIDELNKYYTHQAVNHNKHLVDPITGAHTQGVGGIQREVKIPCRR